MPSYTNIGIAYCGSRMGHFNDDVVFLAKQFQAGDNPLSVTYPEDDDCTNWNTVQYQRSQIVDAFCLVANKPGSVCNYDWMVGSKRYSVQFLVDKEENLYQGMMLKLSDDELFNNEGSEEYANKVSNVILDELIALQKHMRFSYAFCDNEADIEYTLDELKLFKKPHYSILLTVEQDECRINLGSWCVDGMTPRRKSW